MCFFLKTFQSSILFPEECNIFMQVKNIESPKTKVTQELFDIDPSNHVVHLGDVSEVDGVSIPKENCEPFEVAENVSNNKEKNVITVDKNFQIFQCKLCKITYLKESNFQNHRCKVENRRQQEITFSSNEKGTSLPNNNLSKKRGRPSNLEKYFMPASQKKDRSQDLKKQFGLTGAQAKALENDVVDDKSIQEKVEMNNEFEVEHNYTNYDGDTSSSSITRSGRLSKPPRNIAPNVAVMPQPPIQSGNISLESLILFLKKNS